MLSAAVEQIAGGFSSAVIQRVVDKTMDFLESNYNVSHATEELLTKLRTSLTVVKAITEVADNQLIVSTSLTNWLRNLHSAAYEAEDVLDRFDCHEIVAGKRKVSELISSSVRALKSLIVPDESMKRLECVVQKLDHLCATSNTFVELMKQSNLTTMKEEGIRRETTSRVPVDVKVFGRDEVLELILKIILGSSSSEPESSSLRAKLGARYCVGGVDVVPIVGMSGVGKTTLAQIIYNHENVKLYFKHRAWVYVSKHFSMKRTLQEMLCSFKGNDSSFDYTDSLETIVNNIQNVFHPEERFLLVLDSVWDEMCDQWSSLLTAIAREVPGSVVVVTTQSKRVADTVATICQVPLAPLPWESFWPVFQYYAFGTSNVVVENNPTLLFIGEKIARKLEGLPLAAKVMGNLLRSRLTIDQWRSILESDWWDRSDVLCEILPYMGISYQDLHPRQRQSFAFCSIFPQNYLFDKDRLVSMWISHDFIQHSGFDGTRLEDIGDQVFDELVQRSFFQSTFDNKRYTMHDLVRALAIAVSSYECFFHKETSQRASPTVRHLALQVGNQMQIHELNKYKNLRTILLFGHCDSNAICDVVDNMLVNSRSIRVLDLSHLEVMTNMLPSIASLRNLRFLDLSFTRFSNLRNFPCNLQVLYLRGYARNTIPQTINMLANLRHLYVDATALSLIPGIGQLSQLQELENFSAGKRNGFMISELKYMQELSGKLCISNIHIIKNKHEAMDANMIEKKHLEALELKGRNVSKDVLEGLQPHPNLQELMIEGYGATSFPSWMLEAHLFTKLKSLYVGNCRHLVVLPPFGKITSLKHLTLNNLPSVKQVDGTSFDCFPNLEDLKVSLMTSWTNWSHAESDHGPLLQRVTRFELHDCPLLKEVPYLSFMSSLSELDISVCGDFVKALPQYVQLLTHLKKLSMSFCDHTLLLSGQHLKSLEYLYLRKCGGLRLIDGLHCFPNLRKVNVYGCPNILTEFSDQSTIQDEQSGLRLTNMVTDYSLFNRNCFLPSVRDLLIAYIDDLYFTPEQEEWFEQLISVEKIEFGFCNFLERLPTTLARLTSLTILHLKWTRPVSLEGVVPQNLQELVMNGFSGETENNFKPGGSEWVNISHVPYIRLNDKTVQNLSVNAASSSSNHQS
ncbi:putative disease resistance protein RGA4 [Triticum dicoccoides]|uniref:putative disease resistance protein RGA4 n=1 Tax=Triticum dicoccoides TaxID=85692 RepID=UPI001890ED47|nr:putative disease resistance protein RGA4 [Triticum dicoccoides]